MELNIITKDDFSNMVYERMSKEGDFMDSIIEVANDRGIDFEDVPQLLTDRLHMLLTLELIEKNLLKKKI